MTWAWSLRKNMMWHYWWTVPHFKTAVSPLGGLGLMWRPAHFTVREAFLSVAQANFENSRAFCVDSLRFETQWRLAWSTVKYCTRRECSQKTKHTRVIHRMCHLWEHFSLTYYEVNLHFMHNWKCVFLILCIAPSQNNAQHVYCRSAFVITESPKHYFKVAMFLFY